MARAPHPHETRDDDAERAGWPSLAFGFAALPLQLAGRAWRDQAAMFEALAADARSEAAQVTAAAAPQQLGQLGTELAAAQLANAAQWIEQWLGAVLDGQAALVRSFEAWTLQFMRPWLGAQPVSAATAQAAFGPLDAADPAGFYGASLEASRALGRAWINALQHDVEGGTVS